MMNNTPPPWFRATQPAYYPPASYASYPAAFSPLGVAQPVGALRPSLNMPFPEPPVVIPPPNDDLQKRFSIANAKLAKKQPIHDLKETVQDSVETMKRLFQRKPLTDSQLADLDDTTKRLGSVAIATLATLGLKEKILGVTEYVGFLSWFSAMAATPYVINAMVRLKTGVNLNQKYDSTYGDRLNLFRDPNYLPLHLLPADTVNQLAKRFKIPPGPMQRQEVEDKLRQISVQTHTWWMLMAGPATPVIAGLVADNAKAPALRIYNYLGRAVDYLRLQGAATNLKDAAFEKKLDAFLNRLVGPLPESELTSWWQDFGERLIEKTGLRYALETSEVMSPDKNTLENKILNYFTSGQGKKSPFTRPLKNEYLDSALEYLKHEYNYIPADELIDDDKPKISGQLQSLKEKADSQLENLKKTIEEALKTEQYPAKIKQLNERLNLIAQKSTEVENNIQNAANTVQHYRDLLEESKKTFEQRFGSKTWDKLSEVEQKELKGIWKKIETQLRNANLAVFNQLKQQGNMAQTQKIGGFATPRLESAMAAGRSEVANKVMGANPQTHLIRVLKDVKARSMWRNKVVYGLGGVLLLASVIYTQFFVGRNNAKPVNPKGGVIV